MKAFKAQMPAEKIGDADLLTRISPESIKYHFLEHVQYPLSAFTWSHMPTSTMQKQSAYKKFP